jgi:hypothetical protein
MKQTVCDRCGKVCSVDIGAVSMSINLEKCVPYGLYSKPQIKEHYDLCWACAIKVGDILNSKTPT